MSYIGKAPGVGVRNRYYFTASGGETSLSGVDDSGNTLVFSDGTYVDVALNGVILVAGTDYNTTTTNTISSLAALSPGDIVEIVVYDVYSIASAVPPTGGTFTGPVIFNGELIVPRGTTAQRPASPSAGSLRFNTSASAYEGYDGTGWVFLSDATLQVEYLVIAGGGGSGVGGGGAGGFREGTSSLAFSTAYAVTVGSGGAANGPNISANTATAGGASTFDTIISAGGGKGGGHVDAGGNGGSGGGTGSDVTTGQGLGNTPATTPAQGFDGAASDRTAYGAGGGGGGAGGAGQTATTQTGVIGQGGNGGLAKASTITGSSIYYAGGGGGGCNTNTTAASGGGLGGGTSVTAQKGGAGDGALTDNGLGTAGAANTGGGGGGGEVEAASGSAGGSGVVILKVPAGVTASFSAGVSQTSTTVGTDTIYTITAAGASDTVTFS